MRRDHSHPSRMAAATAVVGLGLAFWLIPLGTEAVGEWLGTPPGAGPPLSSRPPARRPAATPVRHVLASASLASGLTLTSAPAPNFSAPSGRVSRPPPGPPRAASLLPRGARLRLADGVLC